MARFLPWTIMAVARYAKMKYSGVQWISEIPNHWTIQTLNAISKEIKNGYVGPTRDLFQENGIKYIQSLHIKDGKIHFEKKEYYVSQEWANLVTLDKLAW